jgi:23S rRNA pseudouridine1911/1915/1917 synthase
MSNSFVEEDDDVNDGVGEEMSFTVAPEEEACRLDKFLALCCTDLSRTRLQDLIDTEQVTINGKVTKTSSLKVKAGDAITVVVPPPVDDTPRAENIPLDIIYEDEHLLVINKPAGLVVHPAAGHFQGTLVNALLYHCGDSLSGIGGVRRPGIVHRLDKDTSGLMMVAKHDKAHKGLSAQLADRSLSRTYTAFVWGTPLPRMGVVDEPIGRHATNRLKMAINRTHTGREARTHYELGESFGNEFASGVFCHLETGRTHQVRVHMNHLGHPLIGDPLYGMQPTGRAANLRKGGWSEEAIDYIYNFPRQALHAARIEFIHPITDEEMSFECDLPEDMEALYNHLKSVD